MKYISARANIELEEIVKTLKAGGHMVKCEVSKTGKCVMPPYDAPVSALIRIGRDGKPEECLLYPDATWGSPCFYRGGVKVPCDQFRDVIERFMQEFQEKLEGGAIIYAVDCEEHGRKWFAILDSIERYCDGIVVFGLTDNCLIL